jgi:signal transduction histidine kinase
MEPSPSVATVSQSDKVKILLVDDQQAKLLSYEVVLAGIGETLIKASSACEAFECLLKNDIGLILIDVCMPDLDGFELAALIREHPRFQRTGIIFVSAVMTTHVDQLRGYALGAFDYVPVPVVPELLRAKVKVFVDLYRKTRQLERLNAELEQRVLERSATLRRLNERLEQRIEERTRERERALAQLYEAQKMDTIGELTGQVAHDFNNLLMAVLGSLTLLEKHLPDDPQCRRLLHNAVQGGQRGASLSKRLLAFSRRQELKPESVDVGELVVGMEELLTRALGIGIELQCEFPSTLPPVLVDANQLELALLNVALNARDAMPGGGRLMISAEETECAGTADLSLPPGDYVRMKIIDTGVGMDEATRTKATEPFFTTKGAGMGTGLGLSVVHGIAAQSGGVLRIDSAPNLGTTVELWLPQSNSRTVSVGRAFDNLGAGINGQ